MTREFAEAQAEILRIYRDGLIEKACEWMDNELPKYIMEGRNGKPYISVAVVDEFKKAMKGEWKS